MTSNETFHVEDGDLVRRVVPLPSRRGQPYEHRCTQAVFEEVAHLVDELAGQPFVLEDLKARTEAPWTQVNVALAFLKERGCVVPAHKRKHRAATDAVHLDAMTEYTFLRDLPS